MTDEEKQAAALAKVGEIQTHLTSLRNNFDAVTAANTALTNINEALKKRVEELSNAGVGNVTDLQEKLAAATALNDSLTTEVNSAHKNLNALQNAVLGVDEGESVPPGTPPAPPTDLAPTDTGTDPPAAGGS